MSKQDNEYHPQNTNETLISLDQMNQFFLHGNESLNASRQLLEPLLQKISSKRWDTLSIFVQIFHKKLDSTGLINIENAIEQFSSMPIDQMKESFAYFNVIKPMIPDGLHFDFLWLLSQLNINIFRDLTTFIDKNSLHSEIELLFLLSKISMDQWKNFTKFAHQSHIKNINFIEVLSQMHEGKRDNFLAFLEKKYPLDIIWDGTQLYAIYPEKYWEAIFHLMSDYWSANDIAQLIKMDPNVGSELFELLDQHKIVNNKIIGGVMKLFLKLPNQKVDNVLKFLGKNKLFHGIASLSDLWKIPNKSLDQMNQFIDDISPLKYHSALFSMIDCLTQIKTEELPVFLDLIKKHHIKDYALIEILSELPTDIWEDGMIFATKYDASDTNIYRLRHLPKELWRSLTHVATHYNITNPDVIVAIALAGDGTQMLHYRYERLKVIQMPESKLPADEILGHWHDIASFVIDREISDPKVIEAFIPQVNPKIENPKIEMPGIGKPLRNFVNRLNIKNQYIIFALQEDLLDANLWEPLYEISWQLFQPPLNDAKDHGKILSALYKLATEEGMPLEDRDGRINNVIREQVHGRMPLDPVHYYLRLLEILRTPRNQLFHGMQAEAEAINIHAEGRDDATTRTMEIFLALPYDHHGVEKDYQSFIDYLYSKDVSESIRKAVEKVLGLTPTEGFGPITMDRFISEHNINMTGQDFFARIWHFINHSNFLNVKAQDLPKDRDNARYGLMTALADACKDNNLVCDAEKIQRIAVGVLQGRLLGINVDEKTAIGLEEISLTTEERHKHIKEAVTHSLIEFLKEHEKVPSKLELKGRVLPWFANGKNFGLTDEMQNDYQQLFKVDLDTTLEWDTRPETNESTSHIKTQFNQVAEILIHGLIDKIPAHDTQTDNLSFLKEQLTVIDKQYFREGTLNAETVEDVIKLLLGQPQVRALTMHKRWGEVFQDFGLLISHILTTNAFAAGFTQTPNRFFSETPVEKKIDQFHEKVHQLLSNTLSNDEKDTPSNNIMPKDI